MDKAEREKRWASTAIINELDAIASLSDETNIYKPNSPYWQSLFRLAGFCKGGYIANDEMFTQITQVSTHLNLAEKEISYQWNRAYARASPRYPNI